jgi:copper homeostasis protein (lipoprotein)
MVLKRQILIGTIATALCLANVGVCGATANAQDATQQQKAPAPARGKLVAAYRGVLPCADCPGIDTTVRLFAAADGAQDHGSYLIRRTYQERKSSYAETGSWTLEKGTPGDASAAVYVLKPKTGSGVTNFLQVSANEIKQLDNDRKPFAGTVNFSLKRVGANAAQHTPAI